MKPRKSLTLRSRDEYRLGCTWYSTNSSHSLNYFAEDILTLKFLANKTRRKQMFSRSHDTILPNKSTRLTPVDQEVSERESNLLETDHIWDIMWNRIVSIHRLIRRLSYEHGIANTSEREIAEWTTRARSASFEWDELHSLRDDFSEEIYL